MGHVQTFKSWVVCQFERGSAWRVLYFQFSDAILKMLQVADDFIVAASLVSQGWEEDGDSFTDGAKRLNATDLPSWEALRERFTLG